MVARTKAAERSRRLAIQKELAGRDDKPAGEGSTLYLSQKRGRREYKDSGWFSSPCKFIVYNLAAAVRNLYFLLTAIIHLQDPAVPTTMSFLP
jgi:hypothetical protein